MKIQINMAFKTPHPSGFLLPVIGREKLFLITPINIQLFTEYIAGS